jgi:integrase/recombinase XerD
VYLASIGEGSRRTIHQSLASLASMIVQSEVETATAAKGSPSTRGRAKAGGEGTDPITLRWEHLRRADTAKLRVELKDRYAPSTANKMLSALRRVLRTCRDMKLMTEADFQVAASLEWVKASPQAQEGTPVTPAIVHQLFEACATDFTASGRRDAAMLAIFLSSGLRRAEAAQLDMRDYDPKTGRLHIRGERPEYDRLVTIGPPARQAMDDWLDIRSIEPGPLVLPVDRGGIIRFRRMTDQAVYDIFTRVATRAHVEGVTLRDLRRAYVISLIRGGRAMEEVQYMTGHASWFTTTTYQALADRQDQEGYDVEQLPYQSPKGGRR